MPPQGDSVGLALEDAVLLARVFREQPERPVQEVFQIYRETRRVRVDKGFKDASLRWEHVKDKGWLRQKVYENFMWGIFWLKGESFQDTYAYDVREEKLQL